MSVDKTNMAFYLRQAAEHRPKDAAVIIPKRKKFSKELEKDVYSFSELESLSDACARYLEKKNVRRQTKVLIMVRPGIELILLVFSLQKIGAVPVIIDPGMGMKNFVSCVEHTKPDVFIGIPQALFLSMLFRKVFEPISEKIIIQKKKFLKELNAFKEDEPFCIAKTKLNELAAVLFTSGATGPSKGVCYEHGMFISQCERIKKQYGIKPGEIDLPMLPVFSLFNPALGMTTVVPEMNPSKPAKASARKLVQDIQEFGVTNSFGSPVLWDKISRYCLKKGIKLKGLKRVLAAGAPVSAQIIEQMNEVMPNGELHTPYGATESLPVSSIDGATVLSYSKEKSLKGEGTCVGKVLDNVEARIIQVVEGVIVNIENTKTLPVGEIGEIIVKADFVTKEYYNIPEKTAEAKIKGGPDLWHRIGDMGYFDEKGYLWFCGRKSERVIMKDGVLYTDLCEGIINKNKRVYRSALIGLGKPGKQIPAIVIEPEKACYPKTAEALEAFKRNVLAVMITEDMLKDIRQIYFKRKLPVDVRHNAKINRLKLAKEFSA